MQKHNLHDSSQVTTFTVGIHRQTPEPAGSSRSVESCPSENYTIPARIRRDGGPFRPRRDRFHRYIAYQAEMRRPAH